MEKKKSGQSIIHCRAKCSLGTIPIIFKTKLQGLFSSRKYIEFLRCMVRLWMKDKDNHRGDLLQN